MARRENTRHRSEPGTGDLKARDNTGVGNILLSDQTIQTQLRRQVILNGLIYSDDETEQKREENIQKLEVLLRSKDQPINRRLHFPSPSVLIPSFSPKLPAHTHLHQGRRIAATPSLAQAKAVFNPKWGDYDVMRHRWHYVQPQTRRLMGDDEPFQLPRTPNSTVVRVNSSGGARVDPGPVQGNYFDAEYYSASRSKSPASTYRS
jgi:hypothetical protein